MNRIKNQDSVLGGVCLGLADELKTDVTLARVVFVILFFTPLPVGIAYILIILGAIFSFKTFFDINLFSYVKNLWPLILIGLGVWIIVKDKDEDNNINNTPNTGTGY